MCSVLESLACRIEVATGAPRASCELHAASDTFVLQLVGDEAAVEHRSNAERHYVALLRGVNVGGHKKISMEDLRNLFSDLGFHEVRTVIQSGNVLFTSSALPDASAIARAIEHRCKLTVAVVLRTAEELRATVVAVPFAASQLERVHVGFLADRVEADLLESIDVSRFAPELVELRAHEAYFYLPAGMGQAKLPLALDRKLPTPMTLRNWRSVNRLCSQLDG